MLWEYPMAKREPNGKFLTHEILKSMNLLQKVHNEEVDEDEFVPFEEDPKKLFKEYREKEEISRQQQAVSHNEPPTPTSLRGTSMSRHHPMSRTSSPEEPPSDNPIHDTAMPRHSTKSRTSSDHKPPSPTSIHDMASPRNYSTSSASSHRRPSDILIRNTSISPRHDSMSRTLSPTSIQFSGPHSMFGPSQQPPQTPLSHFSHAPNGDFVSPTAAKSPSNDETPFQGQSHLLLAMGNPVMSQMNALDQPTFGIPPQSFSNVAQAPSICAQAYESIHRKRGYGNPPILYTTEPSSYLQDSGLASGPMPHKKGANFSPIEDRFPEFAQKDGQPSFPLQADLDHKPPLSAFCLAKGYDPNMGFDPSNMDIMKDFVM